METSFFITSADVTDLHSLTVLQQMDGGTASLGYKVRLHGCLHFMKRLRPEFQHDATYQSAFQKEFLTGYRLQHPNLVHYYRLDEDASGMYMLTEYVEGDTLMQVLKSNPSYFCRKKNLMDFVGQLLDVFRYLHSEQVLYLDLKPDNLMLTRIDNRLNPGTISKRWLFHGFLLQKLRLMICPLTSLFAWPASGWRPWHLHR